MKAFFNREIVYKDVGIMIIGENGSIAFSDESLISEMDLTDVSVGCNYRTLKEKHNALYEFVADILKAEKMHREHEFKSDKAIYKVDANSVGKDTLLRFKREAHDESVNKKYKDASVVFASVIIAICGWIFCYALWEALSRPVSQSTMSLLVLFFAFIMFIVITRFTGIKPSDMGIGTKNIWRILIVDTLLAFCGVAVLIFGKLFVMKKFPGWFFDNQKPFMDFGIFRRIPILYYPINVAVQEFVSRGIMHESLRRSFAGKRKEMAALVVSSLAFGVFHIHMGITFMIFAMLLLGFFGIIYLKQKTIWGLCVLHYIFGITATMLGWI